MKPVLILEDERGIAEAIAFAARGQGFAPRIAGTLREARAVLDEVDVCGAVLDVGLPDGNGLDLLPVLEGLPTVVVTARGDLGDAVRARREGVLAYLPKPLRMAEVERALAGFARVVQPESEERASSVKDIILGRSAAMQRAYSEIAKACTSEVVVLISGPTGSGKTAAATAIHRLGRRSGAHFRVLHCQALPEGLLESELFGHERGAFTGAISTRQGLLEQADGGTLFLDEVGDLPVAAQAKLLRVLEDGVFMRVGGREELRVDLRIITATHRDLEREVAEGRFREDLYYRLRVLEVRMPSLSERREDIPELAEAFLRETKVRARFSDAAMERLMRQEWPGNVRQLKNAVHAAAASSAGGVVDGHHFPSWLDGAEREDLHWQPALTAWLDAELERGASYEKITGEVERAVLGHLLERHGDRPTILARELGINRVTLRNKLRSLGLRESC